MMWLVKPLTSTIEKFPFSKEFPVCFLFLPATLQNFPKQKVVVSYVAYIIQVSKDWLVPTLGNHTFNDRLNINQWKYNRYE